MNNFYGPMLNGDITGKQSAGSDLLKILKRENNSEFIKIKLHDWQLLVDTNPLISEEHKSKVKENLQLFSEQVQDNQKLFEKYLGKKQLFLKKILEELFKKGLIKTQSLENIDDIDINFVGGNIIVEISDNGMDQIIGENTEGVTFSEIKIEGTKLCPIFIRKNTEGKEKILLHELQHFYNRYLITNTTKGYLLEDKCKNLFADETIAQSIYQSFGNTSEDWKRFLAREISIYGIGNHGESYAFGCWFKGINPIYLNTVILQNLDKVDIARVLKEMGVPNYETILAITPLEEWDKLRDLDLKNIFKLDGM